MPVPVVSYQDQNFYSLRRSCRRRGALFKDPLFPPTAQSLFYKRDPPPGLTWKRPREICKDPRLFVDGISTRDLHQGSLGNCWMVAAISCLASEPTLWKKVIPDHVDQEWNPKRLDLYAGIFHFRFWRLGRWLDVVVDDRLPVSADGVLLFCRSATPREFWSALLEKAYAKLNGCYEALEGGNTAEALVDFTGGVSEPLSLDRQVLDQHADHRRTLFQTLAKAHERKALITCSIRPAEGEVVESVLDCGLVRGHAYGITAVKKLRASESSLQNGVSRLLMVRMRNPWGSTDWTGAWSQRSQQWQQMGRTQRDSVGLVVRDVGEFWMAFEDFCRYFTDVVLCHLVEGPVLWPGSHWREVFCYGDWAPAPPSTAGPPTKHSMTPGKKITATGPTKQQQQQQRGNRKEAQLWESQRGRTKEGNSGKKDKTVQATAEDDVEVRLSGVWEVQVDRRSRCGGCINHRDTFLHNPQFMFDVRRKEEEVLMCLQQEDRRIRRKDGDGENLPIGFEVLRVEVNRCTRVHCVVEQASSSVYMDSRSVTLRAELAPGRYVVVPTTFLPGAKGHFLLRLFSHSHIELRELLEDLPPPSAFQCFLPQPAVVTTVHLRRASGLRPKRPAPDVYAILRCEDAVIKTPVFKSDGNPEFNIRTIFYRRDPQTHICIEVWTRGFLWDSVLGEARLQTAESERGRSHVMDLRGGRSRSGSRGCVYVETSSSVCLEDL
ncbi:calpain-5 isoform X2 [Sphaeramia orbicularis]|uniref:Calpain-5-like n=2 Tax=Sphaeramia orbicularis TaxID=375764 RepID=A0A673AGS4_9TELE|nr:calpain-5-like isoform X2 [Sphaeramia orbicularis]